DAQQNVANPVDAPALQVVEGLGIFVEAVPLHSPDGLRADFLDDGGSGAGNHATLEILDAQTLVEFHGDRVTKPGYKSTNVRRRTRRTFVQLNGIACRV